MFWQNVLIGAIAGGLAALILPQISKLLKLSESVSQKVSQIGVVICAILAANFIPAPIVNSGLDSSPANASKEVDKILANSKQMTAEAMQQKLINDSNNKLATITDVAKKENSAASLFIGYYLVNMRSRVEYCSKQGVDIAEFSNEFGKVNQRELVSARNILKLTHEAEDDFYQQSKDGFTKAIETQMQKQANEAKISMKDFCEAIKANSEVMADSLQYSKLVPIQSQILISAAH